VSFVSCKFLNSSIAFVLPVRFFLILPFCACKVKSDLVYFSPPCAYYGQRDRWQTLLRCFVRRMIHTQVRVSVRRRASPERQKAGRTGVPRPADPGGARKAAAWFLRSLLFRPHRLTGRAVFSGKSRGSVDASPALFVFSASAPAVWISAALREAPPEWCSRA